jgi:hypothetical protein
VSGQVNIVQKLTLLAQLTTNNACTFSGNNALYWVLNDRKEAWVCQVWGDRTDTEIRQRDMYAHANALMQKTQTVK